MKKKTQFIGWLSAACLLSAACAEDQKKETVESVKEISKESQSLPEKATDPVVKKTEKASAKTEAAKDKTATADAKKATGASEKEEALPSLHDDMETMGTGWKAIIRGLRDANPDTKTIVAKVVELKTIATRSIDQVPDMVEKMPEGEARTKSLEGYQEQMRTLETQLGELEDALNQGDLATANALVLKVKKSKKSGHNDYIEDEG